MKGGSSLVVSFGVRFESPLLPIRSLETGRLSPDASIYGYIECFDDLFVMVPKTLGLSDRAQVDALQPPISGGPGSAEGLFYLIDRQ
jgi:hypothetical protein